jgi:hypothetical protein
LGFCSQRSSTFCKKYWQDCSRSSFYLGWEWPFSWSSFFCERSGNVSTGSSKCRGLNKAFGWCAAETGSACAVNLGGHRRGGEKMRKPTSCVNEGEHPARFRVWMKNGDAESVSSTFNCFVPMIYWDRRWRKFQNGDEPIWFAKMLPEKWASSGSLVAACIRRSDPAISSV